MDRERHDQQGDPTNDPMAPPAESCECTCLHCGRVFMSDQMWFQKVVGARDGFKGFWMCPTPNCSGAGFCFDIFPTDPAHPANAGWVEFDDDDEEFDEEWNENPDGDSEAADWDPSEAKYKRMDEEALEQEDLEGEEWKYAGEVPPDQLDVSGIGEASMSDEEKMYDQPDQRPREVDWSNRGGGGGGASSDDLPLLGDEDIPF